MEDACPDAADGHDRNRIRAGACLITRGRRFESCLCHLLAGAGTLSFRAFCVHWPSCSWRRHVPNMYQAAESGLATGPRMARQSPRSVAPVPERLELPAVPAVENGGHLGIGAALLFGGSVQEYPMSGRSEV